MLETGADASPMPRVSILEALAHAARPVALGAGPEASPGTCPGPVPPAPRGPSCHGPAPQPRRRAAEDVGGHWGEPDARILEDLVQAVDLPRTLLEERFPVAREVPEFADRRARRNSAGCRKPRREIFPGLAIPITADVSGPLARGHATPSLIEDLIKPLEETFPPGSRLFLYLDLFFGLHQPPLDPFSIFCLWP